MYPLIDKEATGKQIKRIMDDRGITVKQIQEALGLSCVQGIYHWLNGISLTSLDNLYALAGILQENVRYIGERIILQVQ
jgi:transcriptional regulator with XRE-family HTH domain